MKPRSRVSQTASRLRARGQAGVGLIEVLVVVGITMLFTVAAMVFIWFSAVAVSGIISQSGVNQKAGNAVEAIQRRVRFATSISNDVAGNALTLGFADNPTNVTISNPTPWKNQDHFERFQFLGVNSTNYALCASNKLVYYTNINSSYSNVLISGGVRNAPGYKIFQTTNLIFAIIHFGVVDTFSLNHFQADDVQATAISLNRSYTTNVLSNMY